MPRPFFPRCFSEILVTIGNFIVGDSTCFGSNMGHAII